MPRNPFDAIERSKAKALAHFSNEERIDAIAAIFQEAAGLERSTAIQWRRTRRRVLARPSLHSLEHVPRECSVMGLLTLVAFVRTGDPRWLVVAAGLGTQSLMSASFEVSVAAAGAGSCRPSALTKSRVNWSTPTSKSQSTKP